MSFDKSDLDRRMDGAVAQLQKEYSGLRTGGHQPTFWNT